LVAAGYKLLLKPKLNFFLYASPEEILARKQELNADAITSLTSRYMELFESLTRKYSHSSYLAVYNASMDKTLKTVFDRIQMAA
jgi:thymidylate kinase